MRSKFERRIAKALKDEGIPFEYESIQLEYYKNIRSSHCLDCESRNIAVSRWYTPDFVLKNGDLIIETKGRFTSSDRTKMLAVMEDHPDLDIRMVFMRDNKLSKSSDTKYSEWCEKHGIKYAIGHIPKEWTDE